MDFICSSIVENELAVVVCFIVIINHIMTRLYMYLHKYYFHVMAFCHKVDMSLYPGILIVGALVIAFTVFGVTMLGWCTCTNDIPTLPTTSISFDDKFSVCKSLESHSITFQYKAKEDAEGTNQTECVICLNAFEEEESVRKLHSCKHIFHTSCIDRWLASHSGCPLCRTQIDKVASPNRTVASEENDQMIMVILNS